MPPVTGFGGSPLLSLLTGAAKGVSQAKKRAEERQRQAMLDSLRQANARRAQRALDLQEQRLRAQQRESRVQALRERDERLREQAGQREQAEAMSSFVSQRVPELIEAGWPMMAARTQARQEFAGRTDPFLPEEPEQPDVGDQLLNTRRRQQIAEGEREAGLEQARDFALTNDSVRAVIEGAESEQDAANAFRTLVENEDVPEGVDQAELMRVFRQEREDMGEEEGSGASRRPGRSVVESVAEAGVRQSLAPYRNDPAGMEEAARAELRRMEQMVDSAVQSAQPPEEHDIAATRRAMEILRGVIRGEQDAMNIAGLNMTGSVEATPDAP